ncbi:hypothetical protein GCK72_007798 [Caenorhabditis remanei]|uniref:F-box associated domain-containing protein n=1 Tax=Caenorhabditis remanei TaxID=31234 RepID=A0A6A5HK12_CAERE|nr:hypothetical protein GCK72_007798 [Caenorhabditis remanei]KAF1767839.1 hypothetical protein GCK72_007798 [Caenorhabditis remanei]
MSITETKNSIPLSYEATKCVIRYLNVKTRETMSSQVQSIRRINNIIPFHIETLTINESSFGINDTEWIFEEYEERQVVLQNKTKMIVYWKNKRRCTIEIDLSPKILYEKMVKFYVRKQTVVRDNVFLLGTPRLLENAVTFRDKHIITQSVEILSMFSHTYETFRSFLSLEFVTKMQIMLTDGSVETLDNPEVKNCPVLSLCCPPFRPLANSLLYRMMSFENKILILEYLDFPMEDAVRLIEDWIGSNRKTGTRFSWIQKDTKTARDAVSSIQEKFGAVPDTDHRQYKNVIKIPMANKRDLIIYTGQITKLRQQRKGALYPTFEIEIVEGN